MSEAEATQVQSSTEGGCRDTTGAKFVIVPHELQHTHSFLHYLTNDYELMNMVFFPFLFTFVLILSRTDSASTFTITAAAPGVVYMKIV